MSRFLLVSALLALGGTATADPEPKTYALIVGSNTGGAGQQTLRYAEDDARRVGAILTELGGYPAGSIDLIVHPTPELVREHLDQLATRVRADAAAGRQVRVFFYYSGHARANELDLGSSPLPLDELRKRLFSVPAALTVVVLDACQSGAFSRVKGATPAADFSFNSRQQLGATGTAVLASSSDSELSQESDQLRSSYFTHHLLVGLRGAGDANSDGTVSIDEAYRYAYHQTLISTTATAVGGQHVSLEVRLAGHGEVPLSFPRAATSSITLPASLEGHTLVEDRRAKAVVAELQKAKGKAVRIAVAPGEYEVLVRHDGKLSRCRLASGEVDLSRCSTERIAVGATKGGGFTRLLRFELGVMAGGEHEDAYTDRIHDFGFHDDLLAVSSGLQVTALASYFYPWLATGVRLGYEGSPEYSRDTDLAPMRFDWGTTSLLALAQPEYPIDQAERFVVYARLGAGLAYSRTHFVDQNEQSTHEGFLGLGGLAGAGLRVDRLFGTQLGFSAGYERSLYRGIENLTGDAHTGGGNRITFGLSYALGGSR